MLQTHLLSLVQSPSTATLPVQLLKTLKSLIANLPTAIRIASSLCALFARTGTFAQLPSPPTACALLLLALEAEHTSSLPNAGALAQALGTRVGSGKGVVMQRYKTAYDVIEEWVRDVPWLEGHERKKGRSKVAKRVVVARGLKDVVQFQEQIWRKRVETEARPTLELELDADEEDEESDSDESTAPSTAPSTSTQSSGVSHRSKKPKTKHDRSVAQATQFLLDPLAASCSTTSRRANTSDDGTQDLSIHLLTADTCNLDHVFTHAPTRLQLLATERGGAEEDEIADEELFLAGELEGFIRSAEEVDSIRIVMGWNETEEIPDVGETKEVRKGKKRKREAGVESADAHAISRKASGATRGTKKIDMDALARLLDPNTSIDNEAGSSEDTETEEACTSTFTFGEDGEVVEEWRPLSPGGGGYSEDWYDI